MFNELQGLVFEAEPMAGINALIINKMTDGELMSYIIDRKIKGYGEAFFPRCMIYAARKRGLADAEDN